MASVINASSLTLQEVREQFCLESGFEEDFAGFLELQDLSTTERERLARIRADWERYLSAGKVSEGEVKVLILSRLLVEAGYLSREDLRVSLEEQVAEVEVEDGNRVIRGRMDVLVCQERRGDRVPLCVVAIETKNSEVDVRVGLPQLLFYMQSFLDRQPLVWGLVTNGEVYLFVRLVAGRFLLFPYLVVSSLRQAERVLEVLIAIGREEVVSRVE
jgi:hypothetical protein